MQIEQYIWFEDSVYSVKDESGARVSDFVRMPDRFGSLIGEYDSTGASTFQGDALGSTTTITDGTGSVTATYGYSAFGETVIATGRVSRYKWVGRNGYESEGDDRYYVRRRHYCIDVGQWASRDPDLDSLNANDVPRAGDRPYAYVGNNPVTHTDPSGLKVLVYAYHGFLASRNSPHARTLNVHYKPIADSFLAECVEFKPKLQQIIRPEKLLPLLGVGGEIARIEKEARAVEADCIPGCCFSRIMLLGYSFGGYTVYEIAKGMKRATVDQVFTIDPVIGPNVGLSTQHPARFPSYCKWTNVFETVASLPKLPGDRIAGATNINVDSEFTPLNAITAHFGIAKLSTTKELFRQALTDLIGEGSRRRRFDIKCAKECKTSCCKVDLCSLS